MAQRLTESFINTVIPGAYPNASVVSQPVGVGSSGIMVIIGEADGGDSYQNVVLKNNFFTPDQLDKVTKKYVSGPIVDAMSALAEPSNDPDIKSSANLVYIVKTNQSIKASGLVDTDYGSLQDQNFGVGGNKYKFQVTQTAAEVAPQITGTAIPAFGSALNGLSFTVRLQGGASKVVTLSTAAANHADIPTLVSELNGQLPTGLTASAGSVASSVMLTMASDSAANRKGYGKIFTLGDSTPGNLAALGLLDGPYVSSQEPAVEVSVVRSDLGINQTFDVQSQVALMMGYNGSNATLTINPSTRMLTTSVTGLTGTVLNVTGTLTSASNVLSNVSSTTGVVVGATIVAQGVPNGTVVSSTTANSITMSAPATAPAFGAGIQINNPPTAGNSLSVNLAQYSTLSDLAAYINSQPNYVAQVAPYAMQMNPSVLDAVQGIGICSSTSKMPGRVKNAAAKFQSVLGTSTAVAFQPLAQAGLPAPGAQGYLVGGARGGTAPLDIVHAVAQCAGIQTNFIVPLFSQDASADIAVGATDSSSTYTIDALNLVVKNHCLQYSTPKLKRNRSAVCSNWDTYVNAKARAQAAANFRVNFPIQKVVQTNAQGVLTTFQPWYAAVIAAGMQCGGFYKSITNKLANVVSVIDPAGFDSGSPGDIEDALVAGLLVLQTNTSGISWVSDQTTYGLDTNFVYNSMQAVYNADLIALDLAQSFQAAFVGQSLADVNAATALGFLSQKMDQYRKQKLIGASSDAPLGYKNAKIDINAPTMDVSCEIKLATAVYFIPINLNISQITQSAG